MRLLSIFKRKPESAAEVQALKNLDEVTRSVSWNEYEKEGWHYRRFARFRRRDDPDPAGPGGLRDTLREDETH